MSITTDTRQALPVGTWSLDPVGNFSSTTTDGGSAVNRTHNKQNEVTAAGAQALAYDANGNTLTDDRGQHYVYDAWNRLVQVKGASNTTLASYSYDALGRRIVENESGTVRDLYYSDAWQVVEERVHLLAIPLRPGQVDDVRRYVDGVHELGQLAVAQHAREVLAQRIADLAAHGVNVRN